MRARRFAAVAVAGLAVAALVSGCSGSSGGSGASSAASGPDADTQAAIDQGVGPGVMAPAVPVIANIDGITSSKPLEVPIARGQVLLLQMETPKDWKTEVTPVDVAVYQPAPGTEAQEAYPRVKTLKFGKATVTLTNAKEGKTAVLTLNVVAGPDDAGQMPASAPPEPSASSKAASPSASPSTKASSSTKASASATSSTSTKPSPSAD